jgi:hypothetical protein
MAMILSMQETLREGLTHIGVCESEQDRLGTQKCTELFKDVFGSSPEVMTHIWADLMSEDLHECPISEDERSRKGFRMYLIANYMLWSYPRNANIIRVQFWPINEKSTRGQPLWQWIRRISLLESRKIKFVDRFTDPAQSENCEVFILGVDGTDCKTWEQKHPLFPQDRQTFSKKFNHGGLKYEIGVALFEDQICWVNGPFPAGRHDLTIFRNDGLMDLIPLGKMVMADRGYRTSKPGEVNMLATPDDRDEPDLKRFKSRARCRTETVMGRLKEFKCLSDTFRHGVEKHEWAFKAVAVIVQYQIEHGAFLYML